MTVGSAVLSGFAATIVLTGITAAAQFFGLSRMSLPFILGTMVTPDRDRASLYGVGMHFLVGWAFAFVYVALFDQLGVARWWLGGIFGIVHGLFTLLVLMPILPDMHPRMASERRGPTPTRLLQPPGFFGLHYGVRTPLVTLVAHLAYGVVLGAVYGIPLPH
jgi:uncharacterized membrane protein YagU involved in acid resistance